MAETGTVVPQPQTPQQTVAFTMLLSFIVFVLSGPSAQSGITSKISTVTTGKTQQASTRTQWLTVGNGIGWATAFVMLLVLSDISATQQLAAALGWLILVSTLIALGPAAAHTISGIQGNTSSGAGAGSQASGTGATGNTRVGGTGGT